jgi:moderate conductance mechanosensitive channel
MFLALTTGWAVAITAALAVVFVWITVIINKFISKQDEMKTWMVMLYVIDVILLLVAVGFTMWMFGYDIVTELNNIWTSIKQGIVDKVGALIGSAITIFVVMLILRIFRIFVKKAANKSALNKKRVLTILKVAQSLVTYVVELIALLVILALWGVNVMPALAGLGVLGIIIGMGTQSLIKDFISGFFIIFEHHFDVGDIIEVNGYKGQVIDIGLKSTKIRNWKQDIKIFANGSIENAINYSLSPSTAIIDFGIAYKEDVQKTIDILKVELPKFRERFPEIIEDPLILGVMELANSSVNIRVIVRTETEKQYGVERAFRQGIKEILDANNIEIPFPQVVVHKPEE